MFPLSESADIGLDDKYIELLQAWDIENLTDIQKKAIESGVTQGTNLIVSAPTSSGKTLVGELAVYSQLSAGNKVIYLVSHKALADQKYDEFRRHYGELSSNPIASVGLSTGDRDEGDFSPQLLVATYEKVLALLVSDQINPHNSLLIADELQIIGEEGRGPNIEALCAILRKNGVRQLIALTATVENPGDIAGWLHCDLAKSSVRDIELHQEIWYQGDVYQIRFGQSEGEVVSTGLPNPNALYDAVNKLLDEGRGPVLVFTESRKEAARFASEYSHSRATTTVGLQVSEQLELFSEPTESASQLKQNAEKNVAFHSADLTPQTRQVVENQISASSFDVCFATSTLAAGVNFPFKTVVFPKLTYQWGDRAGRHISLGDYRNMSGRAGRLGMHDVGYSVLLPRNPVELAHANKLVLPENQILESKLSGISMRRTMLALVSSGIIDSFSSINVFFENTLYWHQVLESNPAKLDEIIATAKHAAEWLIENVLVEQHGDTLLPTLFGRTVAATGLLPGTAVAFLNMMTGNLEQLEASFDDYGAGLIHWVCNSEEFSGDTPSRFLVYPLEYAPGSATFLSGKRLFMPVDHANSRLNQCAHALVLFSDGVEERKIAFMSKISSGGVHRLATDVSWALDGLHKISCTKEVGCTQQLSNKLALLSRRVRWGVPAEALDVLRVAERSAVPGFGRQRAMALLANGLSTFEEVIQAGVAALAGILKHEERATALLGAVSGMFGFDGNRMYGIHKSLANELGLSELVERCEGSLGTEYEEAIVELLNIEQSWSVQVIDDGVRKNVPDILISLGDLEVLVECKTCTKSPPLIKKEEAFAVMQKAADFSPKIKRVTLGKPAFDEHSKLKVQGSVYITLVEHSVFIEGLLRVHAGAVSAQEFLEWVSQPGVAEIERLSGEGTHMLLAGRAG